MRLLRQVAPILAALGRHKAAVILLVLEIALTLAVLVNLVFVVGGTLQRSRVPTGADEANVGFIQSIGVVGGDNPGTIAEDLAVMQAAPGVVSAAYGSPPLNGGDSSHLFRDADRQQPLVDAYEFIGSQGLAQTLGVKLVQGASFGAQDRPDVSQWGTVKEVPALITRALAERLAPGGQAVGRRFYDGNSAVRVIGVLDHLRAEITGRASDDYALLIEYQLGQQDMGGGFVIRSQPGQLDKALRGAATALEKANPGHVLNAQQTMRQLRQQYFQADLATGRMLLAVLAILLLVTALGVSGLASFWVQQRRRQIGMRRALGATRRDIRHYFQLENLLIVLAGLLLGSVLAYVLNAFLMQRFELQRLPPLYLPMGALVLVVLGQLAVLGPARRAAAVPPVVATRA